MKKFLLAVILVGAVFCSFQLEAQERMATVYNSFSPATVCEIMKQNGYSVSIDEDGDIRWVLDGYKTSIIFYKGNRSIQFRASFKDPSTTFEKHNKFNKEYRYGRSFIQKPGSVRLELDLDFAGGITEARLVDFMKTCKLLFAKWLELVVE